MTELDVLQARLDAVRATTGAPPAIALELTASLVVLEARCGDSEASEDAAGRDLYDEVAGVDREVLRRWHLECLELGWGIATLRRYAPPGLPQRAYRLTGRAERGADGVVRRVRAHARELPLDL